MAFSNWALFDTLRVLAAGSISANYAKLDVDLEHKARAFCIVNNTDGDLFIAITQGATPLSDGTADNLFVPAGSFRLYDVSSDSASTASQLFVLSEGAQFWVRQSTAPTLRSVYVEVMYGKGE